MSITSDTLKTNVEDSQNSELKILENEDFMRISQFLNEEDTNIFENSIILDKEHITRNMSLLNAQNFENSINNSINLKNLNQMRILQSINSANSTRFNRQNFNNIRILQHNCARSTSIMHACIKYAKDNADIIIMQKS